VQIELEHIPTIAISKRIESSNPALGGSSTVDLQNYNLARDREMHQCKSSNQIGF